MYNILVVEDDLNLNKIICSYLAQNNYHVRGLENPVEALELMESERFDLIISDIMMPKINGIDFVRRAKKLYPCMPVLFITALDDISVKIQGFQAGIDDYMVKPIIMDEMVLRVGAILRRVKQLSENKLVVGEVELITDEMAVYVNGKEVDILPREFNILYKLLSHPKKIFTRSELIDEYWGLSSETGLRTVDVYITKLRKLFCSCDSFEIVTVHGFGYKAVIK